MTAKILGQWLSVRYKSQDFLHACEIEKDR